MISSQISSLIHGAILTLWINASTDLLCSSYSNQFN
uniref:Uncharacterized protein n=1 Tax=Arundo donax TaxID=35708 RepID=A0A0A8YQQ8_ARUDO